nr:hypothetical protein [Tanacetum cinerariifolium]
MANLLEDIQCAGKGNGVNILKLIDEGPFQMGTLKETLTEGTEGALHLGPERPRVYSDLTSKDKDRYNANIRATNILLQGLPNDIYSLINHYTDAKGQGNNARGTGAAGYGGAQNRVRYANPGQARQIKCYNCNGIGPLARNCTQPKRPHNSKYFKDKMLLMQAQENGVALDEEQLLFIAADDCDAFDSDVDEAPTAQTLFMANLSFVDLIYDKSSPSYDSNVLSEVHDHDHYQDVVCKHHEVHDMHGDVQPNYVVDSHSDYMSDSNMIPYDQYVKDNAVQVAQKLSSFAELEARFPEQFHNYQQQRRCLQEDREEIDLVPIAGEVVTTVGVETSKPKAKGIVLQEPSETPTPADSFQQPSKAKDKGKAIMIEPEKPLKRKDQIMINEEVTRNLEAQMQAELEEEERLARQKEEEANIALIESWDNTRYDGCRFEKAAEDSSKRAAGKLEQEDAKRQRIEEENESAKLKRCLEIIPNNDEDVTIKATPLSSKSPTIVDYKIYKEGMKSFQNHQSRCCNILDPPITLCHPPPTQYLVHKSLAASCRHVAASYWTAASDVAPTSAPVSAGQLRSTPANHGGDRRSTVAVNDVRPWRTTVDCRWTTVDHHRTTDQWWLVGS